MKNTATAHTLAVNMLKTSADPDIKHRITFLKSYQRNDFSIACPMFDEWTERMCVHGFLIVLCAVPVVQRTPQL